VLGAENQHEEIQIAPSKAISLNFVHPKDFKGIPVTNLNDALQADTIGREVHP
jgi:hypothetical protein